jgi:ADP-heptose:LPS heptosyltransferase
MVKTLIALPWVGEFGWELFSWQAVLRKAKIDGGFDKVICWTRPGREALYSDFAEVRLYDPKANASGYYLHDEDAEKKKKNQERVDSEIEKLVAEFTNDTDCSFISPGLCSDGVPYCDRPHIQKFITFGKKCDDKSYDVLIHGRNREYRDDENWSSDNWKALVSLLKKDKLSVATVGCKKDGLGIDGVDDLRGIPLSELVDYMASSKLIIGPSSGPMHLASLCRCPHLVWSGSEPNRERYETKWNPHNTDAYYLGEDTGGWHPDMYEVYKEIIRVL